MRYWVAFPAHDADRAPLRDGALGPLPPKAPDGVACPCATCGMALDLAPRIRAWLDDHACVLLLCPACGLRAARGLLHG